MIDIFFDLFIRSNHVDRSYRKHYRWFLSIIALTYSISMSKTNWSFLFLDNYIPIDIFASIVKANFNHSFSISSPEANEKEKDTGRKPNEMPISSALGLFHCRIRNITTPGGSYRMTDENCQERNPSDLCQSELDSICLRSNDAIRPILQ